MDDPAPGRQVLIAQRDGAAIGFVCLIADGGLHLFCYTANHAARGFYDRMGGQVVEALEKPGPDGRPAPELRYFWADAAALAAG